MPGVLVVSLLCKVGPLQVMGDCCGGPWCQQRFEIPAAAKNISLVNSSCVSLRIPRDG